MVQTTILASAVAYALTSPISAQQKIEEQDGLGIKIEELLSDKGSEKDNSRRHH